MEQLKAKNGSFHEYARQIDAIEGQVTHPEPVISMLDKRDNLKEKVTALAERFKIHGGEVPGKMSIGMSSMNFKVKEFFSSP